MRGTCAGLPLAAGLLAGLAVLAWRGAPAACARRRVGTVLGGGDRAEPPGDGRAEPPGPARRLALAVAALGCGYALAAWAGAVVGILVAVWLDRRLGGQARSERLRRARLRAELPWAAELLAACLAAGAQPADAAEAVAGAVDGPVGEALRRVVALLRLGGDPPRCWLGLAADPELAAIGRALARAAESGTPLAPVVAAEAALCRADRRLAAHAALARVGVLATAPLGLCFLPAFILIGIVPVVIGLGTDVLG